MDRRENLKVLLTGTIATGFLLSTGCDTESQAEATSIIQSNYGRLPHEKEHDAKLHNDKFFTYEELALILILVDYIIPADETSPSASAAGVPDFIEFMMKDYPPFQLTMRGGLMWLNNLSTKTFGMSFDKITSESQIALIDQIAYPDTAEREMKFGTKFFNLLRNLTATGYFTSKPGFDYLGYVGNRPNQWDGVPQEVLQKFDVAYEEHMKDKYLKIETQNTIIQWDDKGNIIG